MFNRFKDDLKKYWKYAIYSSKAQLKSEIANSYLNWTLQKVEKYQVDVLGNYTRVKKEKRQLFPAQRR